MRLASEIKELLCAENNAGRWESIIDAKLEPVRKAIFDHIAGDCGDTIGLREAHALLSEEE